MTQLHRPSPQRRASRHPLSTSPTTSLLPGPSRRQVLRGAGALGGLAALGSGLAGCGTAGAGATLAAGSTADLDGVTLRVMVNQPHVTSFTEILGPAFLEQTGGTLEVTAIPYDQLTSSQILDVTSGAGEFDVFDYFYFGLGALVDAGALVDLTEWIDDSLDAPDDFLPSVYDPYTLYDGRRYGLPYDGDIHVLFYNTELFDRYGLTAPQTWDDYDDAARTITTESGGQHYGAVVQGQQVPMILGCSFINRLAGHGGELVGPDGAPLLTSDAAAAAAQGLVDIHDAVLPTPLQIGFDQANTAFLSGQAAQLDTWTDMALRLEDPELSSIQGRWAVTSLPVGGSNTVPRASLNSGFGLGVSTASRQQEAAAEFVRWATSARQNLEVATTAGSGIDPNRVSVLEAAEYADALPTAVDVTREGLSGDPLVWPKSPAAPQLLQDLVDQLALAIQGEQDVETALGRAQTAWEQGLGA